MGYDKDNKNYRNTSGNRRSTTDEQRARDEAYQEWEDKVLRFCKQFDGYAKVEIVWDNLGLLEAKENATDKDEDTWWQLYEAREEFCS